MPRKLLGLTLALSACTREVLVEPEPEGPAGITLGTPYGNLPGRPFGVAVGPDGRVLVTHQDLRRVTRVGPERTDPRTLFGVSEDPGDVVLTPDGQTAIVSSFIDGRLHFISMATGAQIDSLQIGTNAYRMAFSSDAADLFVTTTGGKVYRVGVASAEKEDSVQLTGSLQGIARRADGRIAVSSHDGPITILEPGTLDPVTSRDLGGGGPQDIVFSPDGNRLFVAQEPMGRVAVLDGTSLATIDEVYFNHLAPLAPFGLALSPDGQTLVVVGTVTGNAAIVVTATLEATQVFPLQGSALRRAAFAPDGKTAYIANEQGRLEVLKFP
jgi:DNA-binding beta-propeller fold protein YncE